MNRSILAALAVVLLTAALPCLGQSVARYDIEASYDAGRREIEGTLDLTFVPAADTAYLSLLANLARTANPYVALRLLDTQYPYGFETSSTLVIGVDRIEGDAATPLDFRLLALPAAWQTYSLEETVLAIDLAHLAQREITLRIRFITEVPRNSLGDDGITEGVLTWRFGWMPLLLPDQAHIVASAGSIAYDNRESFPLLFPLAEYRATIRIPSECGLVTGAPLIDEQEPADESAERVLTVAFNEPARALAITIGSTYEQYSLEAGRTIDVAYLPGHEEEARFLATLALDILRVYEERYGAYPRQQLTLVENPNSDGRSFAADGIVWLSSWFFTHRNVLLPGALNRLFEYVLAHEIAHQWVGLGTGVDLNTDAWLSEGLAQYLSIRYFEDRYGAFDPNLFEQEGNGIVEDFVAREFGFYNLREHFVELPYVVTRRVGFDEALVKPMDKVKYSNVSTVRLYDKGYLVARSIAATIGEEAFDRALARAIAEHRAGLLDPAAFRALLEEEAQIDLGPVFETWVSGAESVDYSIELLSRTKEQAGYRTEVLVRREGGTPQPVEIQALLTSGATIRQIWDATETEDRLAFHTPSFVRRVTIDPDHRHPDENRLNNNAPVKVVGAANDRAYPLDAYVIAPDVETNGIVLTHLDRLRITAGDGTATAQIRIGRYHEFDASFSIASGDLIGEFGYKYTAYSQPPTGTPATYWEADTAFSIAIERRRADSGLLHLLHVDIVDLPSITSLGTRSFSLDLTPQGAGRLTLAADDELRLLPSAYLQGTCRLGFGFGDLPRSLFDRPSELRAVPVDAAPHVAAVRLALDLPDSRELPFNVFNLAMVDGARGRLFVTAGASWTTLDEFGTTSPSVEAGIEQIIELSTLGGLLPLTLTIGVATPVVGEGTSVLYAQLSL